MHRETGSVWGALLLVAALAPAARADTPPAAPPAAAPAADPKKAAEAHLNTAEAAFEAKSWDQADAALKEARAALAPLGDDAPGWLEGRIELVQADVHKGRLTQLAAQAWPAFEKKLGAKAKEIDPLEAVRAPGKWKGKTIRIDDFVDQAGGGFAQADYDLIAVVNGSAVAAKFDPGVKAALKDYEALGISIEQISKTYVGQLTVTEAARIEHVLAIVTGTCRVTVRDDIDGTAYTAGSYEAPLVRVVALKQGPIAVAAGEPAPTGKPPAPGK